jgi:hypothetical protein
VVGRSALSGLDEMNWLGGVMNTPASTTCPIIYAGHTIEFVRPKPDDSIRAATPDDSIRAASRERPKSLQSKKKA